MTVPVLGQGRTEPVAVNTVLTGEWIITLNAAREIYRDGAIAVTGGVITEVGKRDAILAKYRPGTLIADTPRPPVRHHGPHPPGPHESALFDLQAKYAEVVDEDSVMSWLGQVHGKVS